MPWIVVVTKPNFEAIAAENLQRQRFEHYLPLCLERKPNKPPQVRPLFPRYMFVDIQPAQDWYPIRSTRGVARLLMNDNGPQEMPSTEIAKLIKRHDEKGLVKLEQPPKFESGTQVRTSYGPFADRVLIYDGMTGADRCRVLAELLGQKVKIEMDERQLIAA